MDESLLVNRTRFYNGFEALQGIHWEGPNLVDYVALNVPRASSYGAELAISALLTQGLTLDLTAGLTEAEYDRYTKTSYDIFGNQTDKDLSGKTIQHTPKVTGNLGLTHRHPKGFFARGQINYYGKMYWDDENDYSRNDLVTVDARIGWESESFDAYLYGRNVFGERYLVNYMPLTNVGMVAEPQVFGVEFVYKF